MKRIFKIAKLDLNLWFYSPVAWLILTVFFIQIGVKFNELFEVYSKGEFLGRQYTNLTQIIFVQDWGLFRSIQQNLYLFIPLLTMGLLSREYSQGTIKLLLSSPVKILQIVMGKFSAMVIYGFLMMFMLLLFVVIANFWILNMDWGLVLSGMLGLFLVICAYASIGIFMSSLTSYQVVAAISTLLTLGVLNYVGQIWQDIRFVSDITYFLSISGRADEFILGLITTKDILYFIIVITLFLGLTYLKLKHSTESNTLPIKSGQYALLVTVLLLLGYIISKPQFIGYIDATETNTQTLTPNSQKVVKQLQGKPITITTYVNILDFFNYYSGLPDQRNADFSRFKQYTRFLPQIDMKYVYYYDKGPSNTIYKRNPGLNDRELAKKIAETQDLDFDMFLSPNKMKAIKDLESENYTFIREIKVGDSAIYLRVFQDQIKFPMEQEITAAFKSLLVTNPEVGFLTGYNERSLNKIGDKHYALPTIQKGFRYALINQGFRVKEVMPNAINKDNISILVIADPIDSYSDADMEAIIAYYQSGKNLLVLTEPENSIRLKPLLDTLGVTIHKNFLITDSKDVSPFVLKTKLTENTSALSETFSDLVKEDTIFTMTRLTDLKVTNPAFKTFPLLQSKATNLKTIDSVPLNTETIDFEALPELTPDHKTTAVGMTRFIKDRTQKIVVMSDADVFSNGELTRSNIPQQNFKLFTALFNWFSDGEFPINVNRETPPDKKLTVSKSQIKFINVVLVWMVPIFLVATSIFILLRRKKK
ncbi:Gldg family protein [Flavivirga sp. 57AJ16]|uniref:Gldg family protein n=1 Tax=Flavivirga sp. 57AJ16 TaxID=3025307 RepID=UPI0023651EAD|nr:Gldg family protein [Flavivirga sp. 57AJ16]MDD7885104.1 Gldg family protein [Flavivirga sp. 57AJ16]